jgi:formate hydrogenlyase subunit 3/multisubunit Na+/H+ antiporter MnhD subunit
MGGTSMSVGKPRSVWHGAVVAIGAILIVSILALFQNWDLRWWLIGVLLCLITGGVFALSQARRNRQFDAIVDPTEES